MILPLPYYPLSKNIINFILSVSLKSSCIISKLQMGNKIATILSNRKAEQWITSIFPLPCILNAILDFRHTSCSSANCILVISQEFTSHFCSTAQTKNFCCSNLLSQKKKKTGLVFKWSLLLKSTLFQLPFKIIPTSYLPAS